MAKKSLAKSAELRLPSVPAFWPIAMTATMLEEGTELVAKNPKFVEEEIKSNEAPRPKLARRNRARRAARRLMTKMEPQRTSLRACSERPCVVVGRAGCGARTRGDGHV